MWIYLPLDPDFSYGQVRAKPEWAPLEPDFSPSQLKDRETDRPAKDPSV